MGRELKLSRSDLLVQLTPRSQINTETYNFFALFVERCLDEESSKSKAQSVVGVPDAGLPARGARLQKDIRLQPAGNSCNGLEPVATARTNCNCLEPAELNATGWNQLGVAEANAADWDQLQLVQTNYGL